MIFGGFVAQTNYQTPLEITLSTDSIKSLSESFLVNNNDRYIVEGFGAFAGAFFSFLFVQLGDIYRRYIERKVKHYNALVFYEGLLNDNLTLIHDNIYLIDHFVPAITSGNLYWSLLKTIYIENQKMTDIFDVNLINEINRYFITVRKVNDDINGIMNAYTELKSAFIDQKINKETYLINSKHIADNLLIMKSAMEKLKDDIVQTMAKIRVSMTLDKTFSGKIIEYFIKKGYKKFSKDEVKKEVRKIRVEIKEEVKASKKEIEKIKKSVK